MLRKILPIITLALGFILVLTSMYLVLKNRASQNDPSAVPAQVNFPAPELTLTDTQGVARSLADYRGQVVLVNLWATWCPPCKEEMPTLQAFYEKYRERGFIIIAINDGESQKDVLQFVKNYQLTFPVWLDPTHIATEKAFHTLNLPSSFVIDRNGTIRLAWIGRISSGMLEKHVTPLIKEQ
jgi:cytochrome c biogenesis protein CcmG, thiol:disulfide interchange protein DsbE